jgi:hypothetical protein
MIYYCITPILVNAPKPAGRGPTGEAESVDGLAVGWTERRAGGPGAGGPQSQAAAAGGQSLEADRSPLARREP